VKNQGFRLRPSWWRSFGEESGMTGLLISVRDADEAATALAGGGDLVDIKEPGRGALGAASPSVWRDVLAVCQGQVPTSVALGELLEDPDLGDGELLAGFQFAKLGLAGCGEQHWWYQRWTAVLRDLPPSVAPVAVVYADWTGCQAPPPLDIIHRAAQVPCRAVLFDTYSKADGNLWSHLSVRELTPLISRIRATGLQVVLGGSLSGESAALACGLDPDYIAVRGAACRGSRNGPVDLDRVRALADLVHGTSRDRNGSSKCGR
jgi:(5-formylfuran-3-yl)methyl phosphate synthase